MIRALFRVLRLVGDAKAIAKGRYPQRVIRRRAHCGLSKFMRRRGL